MQRPKLWARPELWARPRLRPSQEEESVVPVPESAPAPPMSTVAISMEDADTETQQAESLTESQPPKPNEAHEPILENLQLHQQAEQIVTVAADEPMPQQPDDSDGCLAVW